jgi:hypothetical protein
MKKPSYKNGFYQDFEETYYVVYKSKIFKLDPESTSYIQLLDLPFGLINIKKVPQVYHPVFERLSKHLSIELSFNKL